jgi:hypothetical protein
MKLFRALLILLFIGITSFTGVVIANHGWDLLTVFFSDIALMNWSGQFNADFLGYLLLSALWIMWRHEFSLPGIVLGLIASVGGMMFLTIYLLIVSVQTKGDMKQVLMGHRSL